MVNRLRTIAVLGSVLAVLSGCAHKDAPATKVQTIAGTIDLAPNDPRVKALMRMMCRGLVCRHDYLVHLKIPNGPDFASYPIDGPYVQSGRIFIEAGETFFVEADVGDKGPTNLHYVEKNEHPDRTLVVTLEQRPDLADGYGVRLAVSNPFGKALKFDVLESRPGGAHDTTVGLCPGLPHGEARKNWPYPVMQAVIANLSFAPTEEAEACAP